MSSLAAEAGATRCDAETTAGPLMGLWAIILLAWAVAVSPVSAGEGVGPWPDLPNGGERFFTFFVTWLHEDEPELVEYLKAARPEVVQLGFYGPMFHGYAHHPKSTGYPMRLPVVGEREALQRQTEINQRIHDLDVGARIIGHFQMSTVVGKPDEPFGFIKWYNEKWDEDLLGPKPVEDVRELLQRNADGSVIHSHRYIDFVNLCISSPHARDLMKRMVGIAIDAGVDGLMSNYNYRHGCVCHWCQAEFKKYLRRRYEGEELREKFGIDDLEAHRFEEIPTHMPGYPDVEGATELHWAASDWGARHFKQVFDEVLIEHGRSLKSDLMIGTWNHNAFIPHNDERAFVPIEDWHRGENYFWYSGAHGEGEFSEGNAGDAWPHLLWLREMVDGKPFMVGKYISKRIRVALAEGVATGGAGTGLRHHFMDEYGRRVMARHHQFVHRHRELYAEAVPCSEVGVVLPRQSALNRRPGAFDAVRAIAPDLAEDQVLFEFVLDQRLESERLARFSVLVLPKVLSLSVEQRRAVREYVEGGGACLVVGDLAVMDEAGNPGDDAGVFGAGRSGGEIVPVGRGQVAKIGADRAEDAVGWVKRLSAEAPLSEIEASWKVRAAAFDRPGGMVLHVVNYDRDEEAAEGKRGPRAELPVPVRDVAVELNLPEDARVASATLRSPDHDGSRDLEFTTSRGRLLFTLPEVEVYGVVDVRFAD